MLLNYQIYKLTDMDAVYDTTMEFESHDHEQLKHVIWLHKDPEYYVKAMDSDSIWYLLKPRRRGAAKLSDELVIKIFELKAKHKLSAQQIANRLDKEDNVAVSGESVANVLKRKTYADVKVPDSILNRSDQKVLRKSRKTVTHEDGLKIVDYYKQGLSGRQISQKEELDYSDATINKFLRNKFGLKEDRG